MTNTSTTTDRPITDQQARRRHSPVLIELDREWARARRRPSALRAARAWGEDGPLTVVARSARSLDDFVVATNQHGDGNVILRHLVDLSATDDLAGRIVMQRLLPGLISGAKKWRAAATPAEDPVDIVIGAAWIAIRSFDVAARPNFIAPALVADSLWIGFRRQARRMQATEVPVPTNVLAVSPAPQAVVDPLSALAGTIRAAVRAGVDAADLDVLRSIIAAGSPSRAASDCGVTARTIRNRRAAAGAKIRSALGPEWADWSDPLVAAA